MTETPDVLLQGLAKTAGNLAAMIAEQPGQIGCGSDSTAIVDMMAEAFARRGGAHVCDHRPSLVAAADGVFWIANLTDRWIACRDCAFAFHDRFDGRGDDDECDLCGKPCDGFLPLLLTTGAVVFCANIGTCCTDRFPTTPTTPEEIA